MAKTLNRSIDTWRKSDPVGMSSMSKGAIYYALADAKHDILKLHEWLEAINKLQNRMSRQTSILQWAINTFGEETANVTGERIRRFLEEAIELAQAVGMEDEEVINMVEYVFARPAGNVAQEIGQAGVSLLALAQHLNINAEHEERKEFDRITSLPAEHWQARQNAKADKGMALPSTAE